MVFKIIIDTFYEEQIEMILILDEYLQNKTLDHKVYEFDRMKIDREVFKQKQKCLKMRNEILQNGKELNDEMIS